MPPRRRCTVLRHAPLGSNVAAMPEADPVLPSWNGGVLRAMRRSILRELRAHGAMTLDELDQRGVKVLGLRLDSVELMELLESARRQQLVAPLPSVRRADGEDAEDAEWAITDAGIRDLHGFASWLAGLDASAKRPVGLLVSLLSIAGVWTALRTRDILVPFEVAVAAGLFLLIAPLLVRVIYNTRRGASRVDIANAWARFDRERPEVAALIRARGERSLGALAYLLSLFALVLGTLVWESLYNVIIVVLLWGLLGLVAHGWSVRKAKKAVRRRNAEIAALVAGD
jgi:hypothetical protein